MITRIHGASSTLAANPPRKHRRAKRHKNPSHHKRRNAEAGTTKTAARTLEARLAKREREIAELKIAAAKKAERAAKKGQGRAKGPRTPKTIARAARKAMKGQLGFSLAPLPAGASLVNYVYPKKGKADKRGRKRVIGYTSSSKLVKGIKPKFSIIKTNTGRLTLHKNPALGKIVVAGVPVVNMAIGSVAAIAIGMISQKVIAKYAPSVASSPIGDIAGELATAGVSAYLFNSKLLKNPMHKSIAQFAFIGAVFQILSKKATSYVGPLVDKIPGLSGHEGYTGGVYTDFYTGQPAVGGLYMEAPMGGMYTDVNTGAVSGLELFKAPSIYG